MSGYVNITSPAEAPKFDHAWRADSGGARASVSLGQSWLTFDDPAQARALAAECLAAADAMEALPAPAEVPQDGAR